MSDISPTYELDYVKPVFVLDYVQPVIPEKVSQDTALVLSYIEPIPVIDSVDYTDGLTLTIWDDGDTIWDDGDTIWA